MITGHGKPSTYAGLVIYCYRWAVVIFGETEGKQPVATARRFRRLWQLSMPGVTWPLDHPNGALPQGTTLPYKTRSPTSGASAA